MAQNYFISRSMKFIMFAGTGTLFFLYANLLFVTEFTASDEPVGTIMFLALAVINLLFVIWRIKTPVIELSEQGLKINIPFLFKKQFARWDEIEGIVEGETHTLGIRERNVKILLKSGKGVSNEMMVSLKAVDNPDRVIRELKKRIPDSNHDELKQRDILQLPLGMTSAAFRGWSLTEKGMEKRKTTIPWEKVKNIAYPGLVLSGYGPVTITYTDTKGKEKRIMIKPKISTDYQNFLKFLVHHASDASIDNSILKALEYPPKEAKADTISIILILFGFISSLLSMSMMNYYAPTISTSYLYPLLAVIICFSPMAVTVKLLAGRFRGKIEPGSKKLLWSSAGFGGAVLSLVLFFLMSPFSYYWFKGDIHKNAGNMEQTLAYYQKALDVYPGSIDIPYEIGKLYRDQDKWDEAFSYLEKAYTQDPTYWGPAAVVLLPDTLMKMGRYDEALQWCRQILDDLPDNRRVAYAINELQDEILWKKDHPATP